MDGARKIGDVDTLRELEAAIMSMPAKRREIFLANRLDDLSYAEISRRTGLTVGQVERQMTKAMIAIDAYLDPERPISSAQSHLDIPSWLKKILGGDGHRRVFK